MTKPMTTAQAAQQNNRDDSGKYATKEHSEAEVDLPAPTSPVPADLADVIASTIGTCPDCGEQSLRGQIPGRPGVFLPGTSCDLCAHEVAGIMGHGDVAGIPVNHTLTREGRFIESSSADAGETLYLVTELGYEDADLSHVPYFVGDTPETQTLEHARATYEAAAASSTLGFDMIDTVCTDRGANMLATAFDVIRDRESIPHSRMLADMTGDAFWRHMDTFDAYGFDKIADHYARSGPDEDEEDLSDETLEHVKSACEDAGLGSMTRVYERLVDNGLLSIYDADSLDADAVEADYERFIAPAIDRVERNMREDYVFEIANDEQHRALCASEQISDPDLRAQLAQDIHDAGQVVFADTNDPERLRALADACDRLANGDAAVTDAEATLRAAAQRLWLVADALQR